jgi:hypothetical protein
LDEKNIIAGSTLSLDKWSSAPHSDVCSLTPSVISSPKGDKESISQNFISARKKFGFFKSSHFGQIYT